MKLTVLVDNNTYIDRYYLGEPGLSLYIEDGPRRILFDSGYSDVLLRNAARLGIDLAAVDTVVLSHGHDDHSRGLSFLMREIDCRGKRLILHPGAFARRYYEGEYIGPPFSREEAAAVFELCPSAEPLPVTPRLLWLGAIPRRRDFENQTPIGQIVEDGVSRDDYLADDSALVYQGREGLFIISGCAHAGICNIIDRACKVCGTERVWGVLGGFHLMRRDRQLEQTIDCFCRRDIRNLWPCHCVNFRAKAAINARIPIHEVGVGMVLEVE
ncbi:MAG: MBL fold metallo-hydrolase [Firmicutes bacterium]|nr:MBL fold metallo-hydrolase [Bacillota bacterium]